MAAEHSAGLGIIMSGNDGASHITRSSQTALSDSIWGAGLPFAYNSDNSRALSCLVAGLQTLGQSHGKQRANIHLSCSLGNYSLPACSDPIFWPILRCGDILLGNCIIIIFDFDSSSSQVLKANELLVAQLLEHDVFSFWSRWKNINGRFSLWIFRQVLIHFTWTNIHCLTHFIGKCYLRYVIYWCPFCCILYFEDNDNGRGGGRVARDRYIGRQLIVAQWPYSTHQTATCPVQIQIQIQMHIQLQQIQLLLV